MRAFFELKGITAEVDWTTKVKKWARLALPNGQFVRTAWKEKVKQPSKVRMSRNIMLHHNKDVRSPDFAEVQYFFQVQVQGVEETVALVSNFSTPDEQLCTESSGALLVCQYQGALALEVIPVKDTSNCIAMVPFHEPEDGRFFVCEKMGLEVAFLGGGREADQREEA
ncbi:hypothetical protein CPB84DRAFT_1686136 [Gymnopilus junonius]|uniref:Uncharacterized protein n=1 Tax=Gymnopilus junonius TaxID=109634 RepID=A0A9P5NEZ2_GYMJU|nr:hypothetical protein CPB84DRAFT_1686136 [Gymnopilus junonius]